MDALVPSFPPPKVTAPVLNYSKWQKITYKYLEDENKKANQMNEIVRKRQELDTLDEAMGRT